MTYAVQVLGSRYLSEARISSEGRLRLPRSESAGPEWILLQKSKVASARIFGATLKREAIDDSDNLSRVTKVAYEFRVRR